MCCRFPVGSPEAGSRAAVVPSKVSTGVVGVVGAAGVWLPLTEVVRGVAGTVDARAAVTEDMRRDNQTSRATRTTCITR